jgi:hypothetical protein
VLSFIFGCRAEQDGQSRIGLRLGGQSQGQSSSDCYRFSDAFRIVTGCFRCFTGCYGFSDAFGVFFRCFAKQDRLTDVPTDRRAPAKDLGQSSRSQGTTTNPRGDVCGGVKWAALSKSHDSG